MKNETMQRTTGPPRSRDTTGRQPRLAEDWDGTPVVLVPLAGDRGHAKLFPEDYRRLTGMDRHTAWTLAGDGEGRECRSRRQAMASVGKVEAETAAKPGLQRNTQQTKGSPQTQGTLSHGRYRTRTEGRAKRCKWR